jgi:hypothetical protein
LSIYRFELEAGRHLPVFSPIVLQQTYMKAKFETTELTQSTHKQQKKAYTLPFTMSHPQAQMIWTRRRMPPPCGIKTPTMMPPPDVESVTGSSSSSLSQASSIGIDEFGLNPAQRGSAAAFSMAVKDDLFP